MRFKVNCLSMIRQDVGLAGVSIEFGCYCNVTERDKPNLCNSVFKLNSSTSFPVVMEVKHCERDMKRNGGV